MKQVKYKIVNVPEFSKNFKEDLQRKDYLFIQDFTIDRFLEYDPPCKECLVQAACLHNSTAIITEYSRYIYIPICYELKKFITYNERFYK